MSHTTTRGRRGIVAGAAVFAAVMVTTAACGTQAGTDISDQGSTLSVPRHGATQHRVQDDAVSANLAEHRLQEKLKERFVPPPAEIGVPR